MWVYQRFAIPPYGKCYGSREVMRAGLNPKSGDHPHHSSSGFRIGWSFQTGGRPTRPAITTCAAKETLRGSGWSGLT